MESNKCSEENKFELDNNKLLFLIYNQIEEIKQMLEKEQDNKLKELYLNVKIEDSCEKTNNLKKEKIFDDYDKIILKNLESRISILEEETQKYEIN